MVDPGHEGDPLTRDLVEARPDTGGSAHMLVEGSAFHTRPVDAGSMLGAVDTPIEKEPQDR